MSTTPNPNPKTEDTSKIESHSTPVNGTGETSNVETPGSFSKILSGLTGLTGSLMGSKEEEVVKGPPPKPVMISPEALALPQRSYEGTWKATKPYKLNDVVFCPEVRTTFRSLTNENQGKNPTLCQDHWVLCEDDDNDENVTSFRFDPIDKSSDGKNKAFAQKFMKAATEQQQQKEQETKKASLSDSNNKGAGSGLTKRQKKTLARKKKEGDLDEEEVAKKKQEMLSAKMFEDTRTDEQKKAQKKQLKLAMKQKRAMNMMGTGGKLMQVASQFAQKSGGVAPTEDGLHSMVNSMKGALPSSAKTNVDKVVPAAMKAAAKFGKKLQKSPETSTPSKTETAPSPSITSTTDSTKNVGVGGGKMKRPSAMKPPVSETPAVVQASPNS